MEKTFENIPSFEVDHTKLIPDYMFPGLTR